jgi:hypothetical protein
MLSRYYYTNTRIRIRTEEREVVLPNPSSVGAERIDYFDGSMLFVTCSQFGIVCVCVLVRRL